MRGGSLNLDYAPSRHVLVRLEGKLPNSRNARFVSDRGPNATKYGNLTGTVAFYFLSRDRGGASRFASATFWSRQPVRGRTRGWKE